MTNFMVERWTTYILEELIENSQHEIFLFYVATVSNQIVNVSSKKGITLNNYLHWIDNWAFWALNQIFMRPHWNLICVSWFWLQIIWKKFTYRPEQSVQFIMPEFKNL